MPKDTLLKLLEPLEDNSVIKAIFSYNNSYSNDCPAIISGISMQMEQDDKISVTFCLDEETKETSKDVPF